METMIEKYMDIDIEIVAKWCEFAGKAIIWLALATYLISGGVLIKYRDLRYRRFAPLEAVCCIGISTAFAFFPDGEETVMSPAFFVFLSVFFYAGVLAVLWSLIVTFNGKRWAERCVRVSAVVIIAWCFWGYNFLLMRPV